MTTLPLISIIMPAYQAEKYIADAIESVLAQTYLDWELWVIDDCSTDNTANSVMGYTDLRIHYHRLTTPLRTPATVRNAGILMAQGDYIAFLDADDQYYPEALTSLFNAFQSQPDLLAAYGFASYIDSAGNEINQRYTSLLSSNEDGRLHLPDWYEHTWENILSGRLSYMLSGLMLPKATLNQVGLLNPAVYAGEDFEFYVRLFLSDRERVCVLPVYIYKYRLHEDSLTRSDTQAVRVVESVLNVLEWLYAQEILKEAAALKSESVLNTYVHYVRECLVDSRPKTARLLLNHAWQNPAISAMAWLGSYAGLWVRANMPSLLESGLRKAASRFKTGEHG